MFLYLDGVRQPVVFTHLSWVNYADAYFLNTPEGYRSGEVAIFLKTDDGDTYSFNTRHFTDDVSTTMADESGTYNHITSVFWYTGCGMSSGTCRLCRGSYDVFEGPSHESVNDPNWNTMSYTFNGNRMTGDFRMKVIASDSSYTHTVSLQLDDHEFDMY